MFASCFAPSRLRGASLAVAILGAALVLGCTAPNPDTASTPATFQPWQRPAPDETLTYSPRAYVVYRAAQPPVIDGWPDEAAWQAAPATAEFVDIQGPHLPAPRHRTWARMLWDSTHFYVSAVMEEPHLWGTLTQRDAVIYRDNDFEIFIDPDGDTHAYYELEINALNTVWDLLLLEPYRDGGRAIDAWDVAGLRTAVALRGTLNDGRDRDQLWSVEVAIPWRMLREAAPERRAPRPGERWRVNFSRVQWRLDVDSAGRYRKRTDPATGRDLPEDNWVWSPQGAIDMHRPERWGIVQFSARWAEEAQPRPDAVPTLTSVDSAAWALRQLYYRQRRHREARGAYAPDLAALGVTPSQAAATGLTYARTPTGYQLTRTAGDSARAHIREDGRAWVTPTQRDR